MHIEDTEVRCTRCGFSYLDAWMDEFNYCGDCRAELKAESESRRLTRHEKLQRLADSGCDTWEEYNEDR